MEKITKHLFAILVISLLLYDCIFVNFIHNDEHEFYSLFPPKWFDLVASQTTVPVHICQQKGSCKINEQAFLPICYCDSDCIEYDDCCFDSPASKNTQPAKILHAKKEFMTCEERIFLDKIFGVWMISRCPSSYKILEISDRCTMEHIKHPVSASNGTIYRNVYCAFCHNVSQYKAWQFEIRYSGYCNAKDLLNETIPKKIHYAIENRCDYYFIPTHNAKCRSCFTNIVRDNNESALCSKFQNPVTVDFIRFYRNVYCINESQFDNRPSHYCVKPVSSYSITNQREYEGLALTRVFNIHPVLDLFGLKICHNDQYQYDISMDICVPNNCKERPTDNCNAEYIRNFKWQKELTFVMDTVITRDFILRLTTFIYLSMPIDLYKITVYDIFGSFRCGNNMSDENKPCCTASITLECKNLITMTLKETEDFQLEIDQLKWQYREINGNVTTTAIDAFDDQILNATCEFTGRFTKFDKFETNLNKIRFQFVFSNMDKQSMLIPERTKGVVRVYDKDNEGTTKLVLEQWELLYTPYNQTNGSIIETPDYEPGSNWSVGTVLTYTTLGCSCFVLMLTLGIYGYSDLFKSSPGIISKHMMATMLAAQLLFIVGVGANYVTAVCTVIGIISHYLWLTSFTWNSIFLFSILIMMRKLQNCPGDLVEKQNVSKVVYCVGYLLPVLFVLPCVLLEYLTEMNIGYSGEVCFLNGFLANLFSFTLPIMISLFFNIMASITSSVALARYNNTVKRLYAVRQARSFLPIYIRLCILCALPWMLGIIADILQIEILSYIFILFSGSHGTFVGFSFLFAKSVRQNLACCKPGTSSTEK